MLGWTPANMRVAIPSPMADTPSVVMNDGTLSSTRARPLRQPSAAARSIGDQDAEEPRSLSLRLLATRSETAMADAPMTPGAERSIEPIISTKVMPQVTTARTAAVSMMFWTLSIVRKSELSTEKTTKITTRAIGGPASRKDTPRRGWGRVVTTSTSSAGDVMVTTADPATG